VQRLRNRTNGIDGTTHSHLQALGISQGEIDSRTGTVGGRGVDVLTRRSPEPTHVFKGSLATGGILLWVHAPTLAFLLDSVIHHEGLDGHRPPRIKDSKMPLGLALLQDRLGHKQTIHDPLAQAKGRQSRAIGSPKRCIGVRLDAPQIRWQSHQGFMGFENRN
jgi:hypothetical protein